MPTPEQLLARLEETVRALDQTAGEMQFGASRFADRIVQLTAAAQSRYTAGAVSIRVGRRAAPGRVRRVKPTKEQKVVARRLRILAEVSRLGSAVKAARRFRKSTATLWRWARDFRMHGPDGLSPKWKRSGRRPVAEQLLPRETAYAQRAMKRLGSAPKALKALEKWQECSAATRALLASFRLRHVYPGSLLKAVRS